jgi:hypothetical protein
MLCYVKDERVKVIFNLGRISRKYIQRNFLPGGPNFCIIFRYKKLNSEYWKQITPTMSRTNLNVNNLQYWRVLLFLIIVKNSSKRNLENSSRRMNDSLQRRFTLQKGWIPPFQGSMEKVLIQKWTLKIDFNMNFPITVKIKPLNIEPFTDKYIPYSDKHSPFFNLPLSNIHSSKRVNGRVNRVNHLSKGEWGFTL